MSGLLAVLDAPSARELQLLSGLTPEVYTANIINLRGDTSNYKATTYTYLDMMAAKKEHGVVMDMDVLALKRPMRTPRNLRLKTLWSGQMGRNKSSVPEIQVWQYRLWSFQMGGIKPKRFLPKNQHTQRKFLNFENWTNREPR